MNFNSFTIKSQEAIQKAVEMTRAAGQQQIEPVHLLKGIMAEGESLINFIFQKIGANPANVTRLVDEEIARQPKVSGGEPYLSRTSNDVLQKSLDIAKEAGRRICYTRSYAVSFICYKFSGVFNIERCWPDRERT